MKIKISLMFKVVVMVVVGDGGGGGGGGGNGIRDGGIGGDDVFHRWKNPLLMNDKSTSHRAVSWI